MTAVKHTYAGEGSPWGAIGDEVTANSGHSVGSQVHYTDNRTGKPWLGTVYDDGSGSLFFDWFEITPNPVNGVVVSNVPKPEFEGQIGYETLPNASIMYVGVTRLKEGSGGPPVIELQWRRVADLGEWFEG